MKYVDEQGQNHYTGEIFAQDGQGVLYKTKNNSIILRDSEEHETDKQAFEDVCLLPLSRIDHMILPMCVLQSHVGYILAVPEGLVPLKTLMSTEEKDKRAFYVRTGGLKRRLGILVNLSKIFLQLHALPVMYGSLSANRVLVSEDAEQSEVWLLYSSGLSYAMDFKQSYSTDEYVAPESKRGQGNILSDYYSFAALAYDLLTMTNTFPNLSQDIAALFDRALDKFCPQTDRPKMLDFYNAFIASLDSIIACKKCGMNVFFGEKNCSYCNTPVSKLLKATIYDKISETIINKGVKIFEFSTIRQYFYNYHTGNILLSENHKQTLEFLLHISPDKKLHIIFKNLIEQNITINKASVAFKQGHAVALPCDVVTISIALYPSTTRCIDIVIQ